jgi:UDP-glucose 4-epimerase
MEQTILVTGGGGYIGSHTIVDLLNNNYNVICIDNFSRSSPTVLKQIETITNRTFKYYTVDLTNADALDSTFKQFPKISAIIHFAAYKAVGESVENPLMYYENNLFSLINLLTMCDKYEIPSFIFSSSCSVYGNPEILPVTENTPLKPPKSPYAQTKLICETILRDYLKAKKTPFQVCILRYFNPAGAHPSLLIGESPNGGVPNLTAAIVATASGRSKTPLTIFGNDYKTRDGTCIRDFIHVCDIASAHTKAIAYLYSNPQISLEVFNLSMGSGCTVQEAINAFEEINGIKIQKQITKRRIGDVEAIYGNCHKATELLNWIPKYTLKDIMKTAWEFECKFTDPTPHD